MTNKPSTADASASGVAAFEHSLVELESIVARLEQGELSLEDSLQQFERGVGLTRICQSALHQAEQKIEVLMRQANGNTQTGDPQFVVGPFNPDQDSVEP